jgi:hypothetical protein
VALSSRISDDEDVSAAIPLQQIAAATRPARCTTDLLGNFADLDDLFAQLDQPMTVIELGKPLPKERYMPRKRIGTCPAAHNRALLGDKHQA